MLDELHLKSLWDIYLATKASNWICRSKVHLEILSIQVVIKIMREDKFI